MAQLKEGSVIKKSTGDEVIATKKDLEDLKDDIGTGDPSEGGNLIPMTEEELRNLL